MPHKTATDLFNDARARITQVTPEETMRIRDEHPGTVEDLYFTSFVVQ